MKDKAILHQGIILKNLPAYFLFGCIGLTLWFLFPVFEPFFVILSFSAVVATVTYPIYLKFLSWFKNKSRLASIVTCLLVIFALVIPLTFFLILLAKQAVEIYTYLDANLHFNNLGEYLKWQPGNAFYDLVGHDNAMWIDQTLKNANIDVRESLVDGFKTLSSFLASQTTKILSSVGGVFGGLLFNFFMMLFSLYFFYKDGDKLLNKLMVLSPIPREHEVELYKKFNEISKATLIGTFLVAVAQGLMGWIGFMIAGLPSPFFWATAVAIFSLVPIVGTTVIWVPAALFLLLSGNVVPGLFLMIWGGLVISQIDNVLRVIFIGSSAKLNPLLTFITVVGGIAAFGLMGVIFGPLLLVMFLALLHVYEIEYADILKIKPKTGELVD